MTTTFNIPYPDKLYLFAAHPWYHTIINVTFVSLVTHVKGNQYKALRLKEETLGKLSGVQLAFESAYMKRMTKDEFVLKMIDCIKDAEPAVWQNYCAIADKKNAE